MSANGIVWPGSPLPATNAGRGHGRQGARHVQNLDTSPAAVGIDIGENRFHIVGQNQRGVIVLRQKWSRGRIESRLATLGRA